MTLELLEKQCAVLSQVANQIQCFLLQQVETGCQVARQLLDDGQLGNVRVVV